jgi:type IV pilus assembly protein PilC
MGGQLPSLTQFLVDASDWMSSNIVPILLIVIGVPVTIAICRSKIFAFRRAMDAFLLAMPGIGEVLRKSAVSRFTRTLATMMTSGVPLMDSLQIVENAAGNIRIAEGIEYARQRLSEGSTLADPLMVTGIFPNMVVAMIRVGEETGALDAMLGKIADSYDEEVDDAIDAMMAMLQPAIMALLGGMVGTMLIGMYLPIFSMGSMTGG